MTNKWRPTVIVCLALILTSATVCSLKALARRERPNQRIERTANPATPESEPSRRWGVSFPSGDTAVVFAVATVLTSLTRWGWGPVLFSVAGAVGLLRITALAHYPSDVLAGALIGILAGCCAPRLATRRLPEQLLARLAALKGRQRLVLGLVLAFIVPVVSPFLGMRPLLIFVRVYAVPAAVLILVTAWMSRMRPAWSARTWPGPEKVE